MKRTIFSQNKTQTKVLCLILLIVSLNSHASITLPTLFSNGIVLQHNSNVSVWGWSNAGQTVTVRPSWNSQAYTAVADAEGNWETKITTPAGSNNSYTITFSDNAGHTKTISNVLIGEVWICAGQSNMEILVKEANNPEEEVKDADYPNIRIFKVPFVSTLTPQNDIPGAFWESPNSDNVLNLGAIPFFFARNMYQYLDIPIGILHAAKGSSCQEAWLSEENITGAPFAEKVYSETLNGNPPVKSQQIPTGLYNGMFKPLVPYKVRGVAWYQGERNYLHPDEYKLLLDNFINSWRQELEQANLPFLITQLSGFSGYGDYGWTRVQEEQYKISQKYSNISTILTYDIGDSSYVHPANKQDVALRMCLAVKKMIYGENILAQGPSVRSITVDGQNVGLSYNDVGTGLVLKDGFTKANNFMLASSDRVFYDAEASIIGTDSIVLSSSNVSEPKYIRYAFKAYNSFVNLYNSGGLPAVPFRTDSDTTLSFVSTQSGDWFDTSTWGGTGIPSKEDNVTITSEHIVSTYTNSTIIKDFCKALTVDGTLSVSSTNNSSNYTINVYGPIACNGTINQGNGIRGSYLVFKDKAGLTGTGTATFRGINLAAPYTDCMISLPTVTTTSSLSITESASKIIIESGTSISGYSLSPSSSAGQYDNYGYYDIFGKATYNYVYLCNSYTDGTTKATVTLKNGGELKVTTAITPVRAGSTIKGIGGSGCVFTVERGARFNFPAEGDPVQFTNATNADYDPNLVVKYYEGSIINGEIRESDFISAIDNMKNQQEDVYYNFSQRAIVFKNPIADIRIYNLLGQQIYSNHNPDQIFTVPGICKGISIVKFTDRSNTTKAFKILVKQ